MRLAWLLAACFLAAILALVHLTALERFWYWYFPWFDVPVHFLGGALMATAVIGVLHSYRPRVFLSVIFLGALGWEGFELLINAEREANFVLDTSIDLLMDALGAFVAYGIARLTLWRST